MQIHRFTRVLFLLNRFDRSKDTYTKQINRFIPILFMLNRFDLLKHLYTMEINRSKQV